MAMLLIVSIVLVGFLEVVSEKSSPETLRPGVPRFTVCHTKVCREKAKLIRKMLSKTVSPCDDFYEFVCGKWKKFNPIPSDKPSSGTFKQLSEKVAKDVRGILSKIAHHGGKSQSITEKLGIAYKSCVANQYPDRRSLKQLKKILVKDGFKDWPLVKNQQHFSDFKKVLLRTGMEPLFSVTVARDMKDPFANIITLDQITFRLLGRNQLINPKKPAYRSKVEAYKALMQAAFSIMRPTIKLQKAKALVEEVFAFESEIAKRTAAKEERRDPLKRYKRRTIGTLEAKFLGLPLLALLNKEFKRVKIRLKMSEPVAILAEDYFKSTTRLLHTVNPRTLFNYMGWRAFASKAEYASKKFRNAKVNFTIAAYGLVKESPLWKKCVTLLTSSMKEVVGRLYVQKKFILGAKRNVERMANCLKDMFRKRLQSIKWMDRGTKQRAQLKLQKMTPKIGYPKWMMNVENLERLYRHLGEVKLRDPFVKIIDDISENNDRTMLLELRQPFNKSRRAAKEDYILEDWI